MLRKKQMKWNFTIWTVLFRALKRLTKSHVCCKEIEGNSTVAYLSITD